MYSIQQHQARVPAQSLIPIGTPSRLAAHTTGTAICSCHHAWSRPSAQRDFYLPSQCIASTAVPVRIIYSRMHIGFSLGGPLQGNEKSISRFAPSLITRLANKSPCRHDVGSSGLLADDRCPRVGVVRCVTSPPTGRHPPRSHGEYHRQRESGALCMYSDTEQCSPTSNASTLMRP